jgi:hypothetical protein
MLHWTNRVTVARSAFMLGRPSHNRQAQQPYRRDPRWVLSLLALSLPLVLGGCYWLKYGKLMRTHIDLLLSMAKKMNDLLEDRRPITPKMIDEFSYPLERARDFARVVRSRYAGRQSLQAFDRFLDTYAELVQETDRRRVLNEDLTDFHGRVEALREQGAQIKAILADEEQSRVVLIQLFCSGVWWQECDPFVVFESSEQLNNRHPEPRVGQVWRQLRKGQENEAAVVQLWVRDFQRARIDRLVVKQ